MKALLFSLLISVPSLIFAQGDTIIAYRHLVPVTGVNKDQLFQRGKSWFEEKFMSSKLVLQSENKETGELQGKGIMTFKLDVSGKPVESKVTYDVVIKVANTGYLFTVGNFVHEFVKSEFSGFGLLTTSVNNPVTKPIFDKQRMNYLWAEVKQDVGLRIEPLMDKLKVKMKDKVVQDNAGL